MDLNQVTLAVNNMEEACAFYRKLGFTQIVDTEHYARFICPEGSATFSLSLESEGFNNPTVIYFEDKDIDKTYQTLCDKGIVFEQPPQDMRYLWREAILRDPSGNKIKLYFAGENRLNPPWRVEIKE